MKPIATVPGALVAVTAAVAFTTVAFADDASAPVFMKKVPPGDRDWVITHHAH